MQLLLSKLRHKDKLALFMTSKKLSSKLVHCARSVTLLLRPPKKRGKRQKEKDTSNVAARQQVIQSLLQGCVNLKVVLHRETKQPFPMALSSIVTEITVEGFKRRPFLEPVPELQPGLAWKEMHQLHSVAFRQNSSAEDVRFLCEALEAGQLPCLRSLAWWPDDPMGKYTGYGMVGAETQGKEQFLRTLLQRLARAAGKQVTNLTASEEVLNHVHLFTNLESLTVLGDKISEKTTQRMCEHPTLRHVMVSGESDDPCFSRFARSPSIEGDHSQRDCKWETFSLIHTWTQPLAALPLAGLTVIRLVHTIVCPPKVCPAELLKAAGLPGVTLACEPHSTYQRGVFHVSPSNEMLQFIPHLKGVRTLHMRTDKLIDAAWMRDMYAALPSCVNCLVFERYAMTYIMHALDSFGPSLFWNFLPQTVKHVKFVGFMLGDFKDDLDGLEDIVRCAPGNVRKLTINKLRAVSCPGLVFDILMAAAPAHLTVCMDSWK